MYAYLKSCRMEIARALLLRTDYSVLQVALYVGYWKVYGDVNCAKEIFARYKACTRSYFSQWTAGTPVQDLAVAV